MPRPAPPPGPQRPSIQPGHGQPAPSGPLPAAASPRSRPAGREAAPARPRAGCASRAFFPPVGPSTAAA
eukprot:13830961-Alexandrium_andersonii.AAC.1